MVSGPESGPGVAQSNIDEAMIHNRPRAAVKPVADHRVAASPNRTFVHRAAFAMGQLCADV